MKALSQPKMDEFRSDKRRRTSFASTEDQSAPFGASSMDSMIRGGDASSGVVAPNSSDRIDNSTYSMTTNEEETEKYEIEMYSKAERERQQQQQHQLPHPSYEITESIIAQEMSSLSVKDREAVYYDIHGVAPVIDETSEPDFLDRKLKAMDTELQINSIGIDRKAFDMANSSNPQYVGDRNFRLRFLRSERFDEKLAAVRYLKHFQLKLDLFGPDFLGRDIVQDDLDQETLEALYCGTGQILKRRDSAGRLIWFWLAGEKNTLFSDRAMMRRQFYNCMMVSTDVETQQKGNVIIAYSLNQQQTRKGNRGSNFLRKCMATIQSMPLLILSFHCCYDNYAWVPVLSILKFSSHLFMRLRFQAHFGNHEHCMFKLQTFGIHVNEIPIDENGNLHTDGHKRFLESRRLQEREAAAKKGSEKPDIEPSSGKETKILVAASADVLLGRGSGYFNHMGNIRYRGLVEERRQIYDRSSKAEKKRLAEEIILIIENNGGRFLRGDDGSWIQIDRKSKLQKIGHSFRALRSSATNNARGTAPPPKRMSRA